MITFDREIAVTADHPLEVVLTCVPASSCTRRATLSLKKIMSLTYLSCVVSNRSGDVPYEARNQHGDVQGSTRDSRAAATEVCDQKGNLEVLSRKAGA